MPQPGPGHTSVHSPFNSEASLQIAARQRLFDYAVTEALQILDAAVVKIRIPEYKGTLEIPVIGGIDVDISNVNITRLEVRQGVVGWRGVCVWGGGSPGNGLVARGQVAAAPRGTACEMRVVQRCKQLAAC